MNGGAAASGGADEMEDDIALLVSHEKVADSSVFRRCCEKMGREWEKYLEDHDVQLKALPGKYEHEVKSN